MKDEIAVRSDQPADIALRQFRIEVSSGENIGRGGRYMTNIVADGRAGYELVSAAKDAPTFRAEDAFADAFPATYFYVHEIDAVTASGEVITTPRTVFISGDGKTLSFVSESIIDSLADIVKFFGAGPWVPPLNLRVAQSTTRKGRRIYSLRVVDVKKAK